jgi:hypothetical protein
MARKNYRSWARSHPEASRAAANLRSAGMSERRIYETFREEYKEAPSYRELRGAWKETKATHGAIRGRKGALYEPDGKLRTKAHPDFQRRRSIVSAQVKTGMIPPNRVAKLERNFSIGYLRQAEVAPEAFKDEQVAGYFAGDTGFESPS